ncbi:MAG: hypothetical protein ACKVSF_05175 [Alphaproteobacteria bacterium]
MRDVAVAVGQRYRKADGTELVFEVVELVNNASYPHARIVQVENPSEYRVIALSALTDRRHYACESLSNLPAAHREEQRLAFAAGD